MRLVPLAAYALLVIAGFQEKAPTAAPAASASADPHVAAIARILKEEEAKGLCGTFLLRRGNQVLLHEAYGLADREAKRAMTKETGFCIGSIVKPIALAALLELEERGSLSLDDTLDLHFKGVPEDKMMITLRQVARHRAGLPDMLGGDYELIDRDALLAKVLAAPLIGRPGEKERYSNCGYSLLAMIIEDMSGMTFEEFVREEILLPAGVDHVGYVLAGWKKEDLAVCYDRDGKRWGTPLDHAWLEDGPSWNLRGNGGMLATVAQLGQWYEALLDGKVVGPEALKRFMELDGGPIFAHAGGNDVLNALQVCAVGADLHATFFTSDARHMAEDVFPRLRPDFLALAQR